MIILFLKKACLFSISLKNNIFERWGEVDQWKTKAPGLILDRKCGLVDEVEVYRSFGGCLPAESTAANSIFKTLGQLNAQKDGDAKTKEDWIHVV
jgi:hypothetical protein